MTRYRRQCPTVHGLLLASCLMASCWLLPRNASGLAAPYSPKTAPGDFAENPDRCTQVVVVFVASCTWENEPAATTQAPGVDFYGFRYYDPGTGRFVSRDPLEEEGAENLYAFAANAPTGLIDVLGTVPVWHHELPQALRSWFNSRGLLIDDPGFGRMFNSRTHPFGATHREWNQMWNDFRKLHPNASKSDIMRQLHQMRRMKQYETFYSHSSKAVVSYVEWGKVLKDRGRALQTLRAARTVSALRLGGFARLLKLTVVGFIAQEAMIRIGDAAMRDIYEDAQDFVDRKLATVGSYSLPCYKCDDCGWICIGYRGFSTTLNRNRLNGVGINDAEWIFVDSKERPIVWAVSVLGAQAPDTSDVAWRIAEQQNAKLKKSRNYRFILDQSDIPASCIEAIDRAN